MKIKSLEIYGYGQFTHRKIEFGPHFTEIFGENEAGKSTIQAFIHSILFGFPTKKENEPRLEPRLGNQYGGNLTLILDDGSEAVVERVKGASKGDVKVYLQNGLIKDESWLNDRLNYITKRTYQGIFSFSVLGLQDIHRHLDEAQLQNYLLQAGALGSTEFTGMRDVLHAKKREYYKRNGKYPLINQQVDQLKDIETRIRQEEAQLESYHRLVDDRDKAERRLDHFKNNLAQLSNMSASKQKELSLHSTVQEWKQLETSLNVEPLEFPEQGINRYESAKLQTGQLQRDIGLRTEKLNQLQRENKMYNIPSADTVNAFESISKKEDGIKQKEFELKNVKRDIDDREREIEGLKSNIGWQDEHLDVDSSEGMKSYISDHTTKKEDQALYVQQLERNINENEIEQQSYDEEQTALEQHIVPEETFEKKKVHERQAFELKEKKNLYQKMKDAFDKEQRDKEKRQNIVRVSMVILALITIVCAVFSFMLKILPFTIAFGLLALFFIIGIFFVKSKEVGHDEAFSDEISQLEHDVNHLESNYDLDFDLDEQYRLREQLQNSFKNKEVLSTKHQHLTETLVTTKDGYNQSYQAIEDVKKELNISPKMSDGLLIDAVSTIQKIKETRSYLNQLKARHEELSLELAHFYDEARTLVKDELGQYEDISLFHDVRQWIKENDAMTTKYNRNQEQIELINNEVKQLKGRLTHNNEVIEKLFGFIGVLNEESYYRHFDRYQTYHKKLNRFNDLTHFLENQDYNYENSSRLSDKSEAQLNTEADRLSQQVDEYNDRYLEMQSEVSELNAQINHLETDSTLTDLRHRYHMLKNQLNENAKNWASLSYLETLVHAHIKQIKDERLPQVVNEATSIYNELTNGDYIQVTYANENVMVKHRSGQMFHPIELSQSTKELLYFALRLSLIKTLKPYYPFPIIIDDAFVHLDKFRKERILKYLRNMSNVYQILYFTCTKDQTIPQKQLLVLNKVEEGVKK
ncbi:AAA family ATPase [Staphylococcus massiliensis]|uniref:ATP-binding protein n=1 Tax=Staphylococcus massiliensis TaxID=555791 RepID=UPI00370D78B4